MRASLDVLRNPRVAVPLGGTGFLVVVAGVARFFVGGWLVAVAIGLAAVLIALIVVLILLLLRQERTEHAERGLEDGAAREARQAHEERAGARARLEERFRAAVDAIRRSRLGRDGLEALPWVMLIGGPGSGKSALARESGLELPAEFARLPQTGPTRDCDVWPTNEMVLLDVSGRLCSEGAEEARPEWQSLLRLVRDARPGCPLNGVVLALPAPELLGRPAADLEEEARALRRTLNELSDQLGVDPPVYVVVTKADAIEGFAELASVLPPNRLGEAFGWTNPERRFADAADLVQRGIEPVARRLDLFLPELLAREPDPERRRRLFLLPQELGEVSRTLAVFLRRAFAPSRYDETPFLRGVYFTSALREGQTVPTVGPRLGLVAPPAPLTAVGAGRGLFVRDFFRDLVLGDRELALPTERFGPRARRVLLATAAVAVALAALVWSVPFVENLGAIHRIEAQVRDVGAGGGFAALDRLRRTVEGEEAASHGLSRRLGLGGPLALALERARAVYVADYGRSVEEPVKSALLAAAERQDGTAFEALAELALDVAWLDGKGSGPGDARPGLARFAGERAADPEAFAGSYDAFVRWIDDDARLPRLARERDAFTHAAAQLLDLDRLEAWSGHGEGGGALHYTDVGLPAPADGAESVPAAYTRQTWEALVKPLVTAVQHTGGASPARLAAFEQGYVQRWDASWRRYLLAAPTAPQADPAPKGSVWLALVQQIDEQNEADLPRPGAPPPWLAALRAARSEQAPEGQSAPWPRYQAALDQVAAEVAGVQGRPEAALDLAGRVARREPDACRSALDGVQAMVPVEGDPQASAKLRELLSMPILNAFSAVLDEATNDVDQRWRERIATPFGGEPTQTALDGLYAPSNGALARFRAETLEPFFAGGAPKPVLEDRALPLGPHFLAWMRDAESLQRALFPGLGAPPRLAVRLEGVPSQITGSDHAVVSRRDLLVTCPEGTTTFTYREGTGAQTFLWTPACQDVSLRINVREASGEERELKPRREWRGPFALPNFLREAEAGDGGRLQWLLRYPEDKVEVRVVYVLRSGEGILGIAYQAPPASVRE